MNLLTEFGSSIWAAVIAAVLGLLAFGLVQKGTARRFARLVAVMVSISIWISAQLYKEFTGEGLDDVARHYLARAACGWLGICKPQAQSQPGPISASAPPAQTRKQFTIEPISPIPQPAAVPTGPGRTPAMLHMNKAAVYLAEGDNDHAIVEATSAIQLDPTLGGGYGNRAAAYLNKGDYEHAISDYGEEIRLDPGSAGAYVGRGQAFLAKDDFDHAIADYDLAIRLDPKMNAAIYVNRATAHASKGNYDRAIADYDQAIRLDPRIAMAHTGRSLAYFEKGENVQAIAAATEAIRLDPNLPQSYYARGLAIQAMGNNIAANADFAKARELTQKIAN